jgi:hypothetical protein
VLDWHVRAAGAACSTCALLVLLEEEEEEEEEGSEVIDWGVQSREHHQLLENF